jgi:hypothetical protein
VACPKKTVLPPAPARLKPKGKQPTERAVETRGRGPRQQSITAVPELIPRMPARTDNAIAVERSSARVSLVRYSLDEVSTIKRAKRSHNPLLQPNAQR